MYSNGKLIQVAILEDNFFEFSHVASNSIYYILVNLRVLHKRKCPGIYGDSLAKYIANVRYKGEHIGKHVLNSDNMNASEPISNLILF